MAKSVLNSSTENCDHQCDLCLTDDQHVEAEGFCVTCREYLCENCLKFHKRTRALKHHELLGKDKMATYKTSSAASTSDVLTERCMIHRDELIKFFCLEHEALGCCDCITMNHRTCQIDYIPDKCSGIVGSKDYMDMLQKLEQKLKEMEGVMKKAETKDKEIDSQYKKMMEEIEKFRKEINDRLDQIQKEIVDRANERRSNDKKLLEESMNVCSSISSDVQKLQQKLQDSNSSDQQGKLYIAIKQASTKLTSDTIKTVESSLDEVDVQYDFRRDGELEKSISKREAFGKLRLTARVGTSQVLEHVDDINVRTESDKGFKCNVIGCAALASNKVVLIDGSLNKKLKLVDTERKEVIDEKILEKPLSGITALPNDHIAVTVPKEKEILIMKTADKIEFVRRIKLEEQCQSITSHRGRLFIFSNDPNCILIVNLQDGDVLKKLPLKNEKFGITTFIAYSHSADRLYVSDHTNSRVVGITLNGEVFRVYQNSDLRDPCGLLVLNNGSLLLTSEIRKTIFHVSRDLDETRKEVVDGHTYAICCDPQQTRVYTGSFNSDLLNVFSLQ